MGIDGYRVWEVLGDGENILPLNATGLFTVKWLE